MVSQFPDNQHQIQILKILTKTWARDSHGLFDYEANTTKNNLLLINGRYKIARKKNDVRQVTENTELDMEDRELARVKLDGGKYYLSNPISFNMAASEQNINDMQNKIWYVVKQEDGANATITSSSNDIYDIKINDIIKLGRVKYAITEMKLNNTLLTIDKDVENPVFNLICDYKKFSQHSTDVTCKICLSHQEEDSNPLINLCRCTGSISWVHFFCLKAWMNTKLSIKENEKKTVTSYNMKSFNCEICKTPYPLRFRSENSFFDLIDYTRPQDKNYIILESLNQLKDNNNYKSIQVVSLEENEKIIMGRGHETDVRINDISVSRTHALLLLSNNKIYIKDLKSKFGTLILVQDDLEMSEKPLYLQIGRTCGEFVVIGQKEYHKIKKDLIVKTEEKEKILQLKNKLLFQVEKPEKKDSGKMNPANYLNGMEIDSMQNTITQNLNIYCQTAENQAYQTNSPLNIFVNKMI